MKVRIDLDFYDGYFIGKYGKEVEIPDEFFYKFQDLEIRKKEMQAILESYYRTVPDKPLNDKGSLVIDMEY